jgi:hypothetical protein
MHTHRRQIAGQRLSDIARHQDQLRQDVFIIQRVCRDANRFNKPKPVSSPKHDAVGDSVAIILLVGAAVVYAIWQAIHYVVHAIVSTL